MSNMKIENKERALKIVGQEPKYKIGDIVMFNDTYSNNDAHKTLIVGTIAKVSINLGRSIFGESLPRITYSINDFGLTMKEEDLTLIKGYHE